MRPKLRSLSIRPHTQDGHPYLLLRDPQQITEHTLLIPRLLATVLAFCDGEHEMKKLPDLFQQHTGFPLTDKVVEALIRALDEALMLENDHFFAVYDQTLTAYRQAPHRTAALAGLSYPQEKHQLWQLLQDYLETVDHIEPLSIDWSRPVGLVSPHIDYPRGGAVYAQVWKRAAYIAQEAEIALFLGTDHYGGAHFTLTRQNYATPYGVLPTEQTIVDQLAQAIGEEAAFAGELRHRGEHSLELVAVWLHHLRAGQPCAVVPILCGGFHQYLKNGAIPAQDPLIARVIATLRRVIKGRRTVVIASGDLAHVGPAFGGEPLTTDRRALVNAADEQLLTHMSNGDVESFFNAIQQVQDANNVCGLAPIYLTMHTLADSHPAPLRGHPIGYATCPADEYGTSVVTVGGMIFH